MSPKRAQRTLAETIEGYLKNLEEAGKGRGTVFGYSVDLALATKHFGAETLIGTITEDPVAAFFGSDLVTKKRTGSPKAQPTILKTRRAFRLALTWAKEQGYVAELPIPETYRPRREAKA